MSSNYQMFWNEHGERVQTMLSSSDARIDDIPRIMREHRDMRKALLMAVELLEQANLDSSVLEIQKNLDYIKRIKKKNPI